MPTVDDILGAPEAVDDGLGPSAAPQQMVDEGLGPKAPAKVPELSSFNFSLPPPKAAGALAMRRAMEDPEEQKPLLNLGDFLIKGPGEAKTDLEEGANQVLRGTLNSLT